MEAPPIVLEQGDIVKLSENPDEVRRSFDDIPFIWADEMVAMCGQEFTVLEAPGEYSQHLEYHLPPGVIGLASPDGSQGNTWFFATAVVEKLQSRGEHALLVKYSMAIGKSIAGIVRFLFEDVLQGFCQIVFLIKKWHFTTLSSKVFTTMSLSAGITLSLFVPLKEYLAAQKLKKRAISRRPELAGYLKIDQAKAGGASSGAKITDTVHELSQEDPMETTIGRDMYIVEYLQGKGYTTTHASICYKLLVASSTLFWTSMIVLAFALRPTCGGDQPWLRYIIFMLVTCVDLVAQFWVLLHSKLGYHLVVFKPWKLFAGIVLTVLGHFDTFADVSFAGMVQNCDDIVDVRIKERYFHLSFWRAGEAFDGDRIFPLPCKLADMSFFALIVGVYAFQALPGLCMLLAKVKLPVAFKMNELNLLLTLMDEETWYMSGGDEGEGTENALDVFRASGIPSVDAQLLQASAGP